MNSLRDNSSKLEPGGASWVISGIPREEVTSARDERVFFFFRIRFLKEYTGRKGCNSGGEGGKGCKGHKG